MKNSGPARSASPAQRALMRAGLLVTALGAALGAGGAPAMAADASGGVGDAAQGLSKGLTGPLQGVGHAVAGITGTLKDYQLDPMANTGVDPLDNGVGTQVADFRPVGTNMVTDPITRGGSLSELPLVGPVAQQLPG